MRIISGKYRGKVLIAPRSLPVRPTTDFAKEALFNLVSNHFHLDQISVLDLFAGTGNISYEFGSRGTVDITCVDASHHCARYIKETAKSLKFDALHSIKGDAVKFAAKAYRKWDLVFADPPYDFKLYTDLLDAAFGNKIVENEGMLIIEHPIEVDLSQHPNFIDCRKYGKVHFSFFEPTETE